MTSLNKRLIFEALFILKEFKILGKIFKIESKDYYIFNEAGDEIRCSLRGRFQKEYALKRDKLYTVDIAAVGDFVQFEINKDGTGVIIKIEERKNHISRKAPKIKGSGTRGERLEQIIAANIDSLIVVSSAANPKFNNKLIDRILVAGESSHVEVIIVVNKMDLAEDDYVDQFIELYKNIGYKIFATSIVDATGFGEFYNSLVDRTCLIWGQSGVGKSSLLNKIFPELSLKTGEVSERTSKGKHTTVTSVMKKINPKTFVIDTPGIREIDPYGIRKEDLGHYFIDFKPYINECKFNTCTHNHEPGCAVTDAVERELISADRYESYLNILSSIEDDMNF